ncbi:DUF943 family protein [Erwinia pyrifoliae]|uniref:DUF943 family protein n=1 Tax=Erwinia pyrifoliae TaxID=79967 RepID=UPI00220A3AA4|nr:DUF943 family protein [Erwinia pyrifoliae]UWS29612.1 DUF943 family protein [Erwinia pyrifoliae]
MLIPRCRSAAASLDFRHLQISITFFFRSTERQPPIIDYFTKNNKKNPFTDSGKIEWWLKNRDMLKEKYDTPEPESDGSFTVVFWLFGEGYKEEGKSDRQCFEDRKTQKKCIDKNSLILVKNSKKSGMYFILDSGTYRINDAGEIRKNKPD